FELRPSSFARTLATLRLLGAAGTMPAGGIVAYVQVNTSLVRNEMEELAAVEPPKPTKAVLPPTIAGMFTAKEVFNVAPVFRSLTVSKRTVPLYDSVAW